MEEECKPASVSISELANCIQGEILNCPEQAGELVENLMVGAMCVDPAPLYFSQKPNKAVITRGDRADIQLGALETSTKCLILTGGTKPHASVVQRAEEKGVPILVVDKDTPSTLAELEQGLSQIVSAAPAASEETSETPEA